MKCVFRRWVHYTDHGSRVTGHPSSPCGLRRGTRVTGHTGRRLGFTLMELIIVIGIIAILLAMILGSVSGLSNRGKQTQCLSNMRQFAGSMALYAGDHDGIYPREGVGSGGVDYDLAEAWYNALAPYLGIVPMSNLVADAMAPFPPKDKSVFACPSLRREDVVGSPSGIEPVFYYAINLWIYHDARATDNPGGQTGLSDYLRASQITKPSNFALFGEGNDTEFDNTAARDLHYRHQETNAVNIALGDGRAATFKRTDVFVASGGDKSANRGVIWNPEGNPPQETF